MKKQIIPVYILVVILCAVLFTDRSLAQEQIAGGWAPAAVTKSEVVATANFAITAEQTELRKNKETPEAKLSLISILRAEEQVVAGMNYHLTLKVKLNGKVKKAEATVWWQAWNKEAPYKLTSWKWK